jgi:hypothetical protein
MRTLRYPPGGARSSSGRSTDDHHSRLTSYECECALPIEPVACRRRAMSVLYKPGRMLALYPAQLM